MNEAVQLFQRQMKLKIKYLIYTPSPDWKPNYWWEFLFSFYLHMCLQIGDINEGDAPQGRWFPRPGKHSGICFRMGSGRGRRAVSLGSKPWGQCTRSHHIACKTRQLPPLLLLRTVNLHNTAFPRAAEGESGAVGEWVHQNRRAERAINAEATWQHRLQRVTAREGLFLALQDSLQLKKKIAS